MLSWRCLFQGLICAELSILNRVLSSFSSVVIDMACTTSITDGFDHQRGCPLTCFVPQFIPLVDRPSQTPTPNTQPTRDLPVQNTNAPQPNSI